MAMKRTGVAVVLVVCMAAVSPAAEDGEKSERVDKETRTPGGALSWFPGFLIEIETLFPSERRKRGRGIGMPRAESDTEREERTVDDWHYWVARGDEF